MKSSDIKELRKDLGLSQSSLAEILGVSRGTIVNYENGKTIPASKRTILNNLKEHNIEHLRTQLSFTKNMLKGTQDYIKAKNDAYRGYELTERDGVVREPDAHWYGDPSIMMVPMISHRAQAGFLAGWADEAQTLEDFPKIPWEVDREYKGRYVCFEVTGDSMDDGTPEALLDGDVILCREVMQQHWKNRLHINQWDFVIAHKDRGIVVKRITEHEVETGRLVLHSLNEMYEDYEVYLQDCIAIFNVVDVKRSRRRR